MQSRQDGQGARQSTLRSLNLALVAEAVFARPGRLTRADVAHATGMTRSTVSRLVDQLVAGGILTEDDPVVRRGPGRPGVPLRPAPGTFVALGLEANVGHLACTAVDLAGTVMAHRLVAVDLAGSDPEATLGQLQQLGRSTLADLPSGARLTTVRVALPGIVDHQAAVLLRAPNLGWTSVDVTGPLAGLSPSGRVEVDNEADCAALTIAQATPGGADPENSFLYVSGNVGIGSATVVGGRVVAGRHGWAGELGHVCVDPAGPRCGCGATGCLEAVAGRRALLGASGHRTWESFLQAVDRGEEPARSATTAAGTALGVALASALNLLDLSQVVLGGHLADLADEITPAIRHELDTRVLAAPFEPLGITARRAAEAPGALGAAYQGVLDLIADPARALGADEGLT
ncbi:MAG: ROK family protein [Propioniciclava sp.]